MDTTVHMLLSNTTWLESEMNMTTASTSSAMTLPNTTTWGFVGPSTTPEVDGPTGSLINDKTAENVLWILSLVILPGISIPGIVGNVSSLFVLYRHGFKKTSNILLAALTFADACYLIGVNNIAYFVHEYSDNRGFHFSVGGCYFLYGLYRLYFLLELWGNWCSLTLPLLITVERLVAVYYPFRFPTIVTPWRTWTAIIIVYIMWVPINVYYFFLEDLFFKEENSKLVGYIEHTILYTDDYYKEIYLIVRRVAIIVSEPVPVLLVITGCTLVGIKVREASIKRRKMMSAVHAVSQRPRVVPAYRTTWTLMLVCLVYTVTIGSAFILQISIDKSKETNLNVILETMVRLVKCLHSSCNFFIYIYVNRNFRDTYRGIFGSFTKRKRRPESESTPPSVPFPP